MLLGLALVVVIGVDWVRNVTLGVCGEAGGLICDALFADIVICCTCCFKFAVELRKFFDWINDASAVSDLSK